MNDYLFTLKEKSTKQCTIFYNDIEYRFKKYISKGKSIDFKPTYLWFDPLVRLDFLLSIFFIIIIFQFSVSSSGF